MPRFSIRNPYFIVVVCLALAVIGMTSIARMPVDLFPVINFPPVVVKTFYSGMPPEDIEADITNPLERFVTLATGIVSIIKVFFQPGTNAETEVTGADFVRDFDGIHRFGRISAGLWEKETQCS